MSTDESEEDVRKRRVKEIRESLNETQKQFAARLTTAAKELGFDIEYTENLVTKMETGYRKLGLRDVACLTRVDNQRRTWFRVAFDRDEPARPAVGQLRSKPIREAPEAEARPTPRKRVAGQ